MLFPGSPVSMLPGSARLPCEVHTLAPTVGREGYPGTRPGGCMAASPVGLTALTEWVLESSLGADVHMLLVGLVGLRSVS